MGYNYSNGDGVAVLLANEPNGATEPVSILDNAIRQIKAYLNDPVAGPSALINSLLPIGIVITGWTTTTPPSGWLLCDGAAISRTDFAALFDVIGTTFGSGNGSSTFNVPDLRDRFVKGKSTDDIADTGGASEVALTASQMPVHSHEVRNGADGDQTNPLETTNGFSGMDASGAIGSFDNIIRNAGGGLAHENKPPYITLVAIIKF